MAHVMFGAPRVTGGCGTYTPVDDTDDGEGQYKTRCDKHHIHAETSLNFIYKRIKNTLG